MGRDAEGVTRTGRWRQWAVAALVALAACSTAPAEQGPTTLRVLLADDWAGTAAVVDAVRDFEAAHSDVLVQVQGQPFSQIPDTVRAANESGEPPDVAQWHAFAAAAQGLAAPLDDEWATLDPQDYVPGAIEDVRWQGRFYGMPLDVNAMVLMANAGRLAANDVALPTGPMTFGDVRRIAEATTAADGSTRGFALASSSWTTYGWIRANGGEVVAVDDDGGVTFTLDAPAVVETLDFLGALVRDGIAYPPFAQQSSTDSFSLFRTQSTALHVSGMWDAATLAEAPWDVTVLPMPRGMDGDTVGSALGGSSLFVPSGSGNRELAFAFMRHLTSDSYALRLAEENGRLPARRAVFEAPFFDTTAYRTVVEQLESAHPMQLIAFPEAARAFTVAIDEVLTGRQDAAAALARAQQAAEQSAASGA